MKEEREHLLSSWIIHNQFHREPDRRKTSEWRAWGINAWACLLSHARFPASGHKLSWSSALFSCPTSVIVWSFFLFCKSSRRPRAFNPLNPQPFCSVFTLFKGLWQSPCMSLLSSNKSAGYYRKLSSLPVSGTIPVLVQCSAFTHSPLMFVWWMWSYCL